VITLWGGLGGKFGGIAVDSTTGVFYWTEDPVNPAFNSVLRTSIADPPSFTPLYDDTFGDDIFNPGDIVLDTSRNRMYYIDDDPTNTCGMFVSQRIMVATLDGSNGPTPVIPCNHPVVPATGAQVLAYDPFTDTLYFTKAIPPVGISRVRGISSGTSGAELYFDGGPLNFAPAGIDFDPDGRQVYFVNGHLSPNVFEIRRAPADVDVSGGPVGTTELLRTTSGLPLGLALDPNSSTMCWSELDPLGSNPPSIICGDRGTDTSKDVATVLDIPGTLEPLGGEAPKHLAIEGTKTVTPDTVPDPPIVAELNVEALTVKLTLEKFTKSTTKKKNTSTSKLVSESPVAQAKKGKKKKKKTGVRYETEIERTADADGNPIIDKKEKDTRKKISKKNNVTFKKLKPNSTYSSRNRVQITKKKPDSKKPTVVKKTGFSSSW